jgi:N-acetyl-anhydromuramyl-L-alanine amidase AmpD
MYKLLNGLRARITLLILAVAFLFVAIICLTSYRNTIKPAGIIIHHSAVPPPKTGPAVDISYLDMLHQQRGFGIFYWGKFYHIGYHYVILPDGELQTGRPEHCLGAHTSGYNSYTGICLVGDFSVEDNPHGERGLQRPADAQMKTLLELISNLQKKYGIPSQRILRHNEVNPNTECPGNNFPISYLEREYD